jgi:WD40 repeat protein
MYHSVVQTIPRNSRFAQYFVPELAQLDCSPVIDPQPWTQRLINMDSLFSRHVAFSPSGDTLVCADEDGVKSICTRTGRQLFSPRLDGEEDFVIESIAFRENSVPIASTKRGKNIAVKDMETWETLVELENCRDLDLGLFGDGDLRSSNLSADGQLIAIGRFDYGLTVWKLFDEDGPTRIFRARRADFHSFRGSFSGNNQILAICADRFYSDWNYLDVYDLSSRAKRFTRKGFCVSCEVSHESHAIGYAPATDVARNRRMEVLDIETGNAVFSLPGDILGMAFSPDGKTLAYSKRATGLFLCSATDGSGAIQLPRPEGEGTEIDAPVHTMRFSPQGDRLACLHSNWVTLWTLNRSTAARP